MAVATRYAVQALFPTTTAGTPAFGTHILDGTTDALEFIVQAPEAATITHLGFRYGLRALTPPTYRVSIQGVGTTGNPDGTIKGGGSPASATFTPPASTAWDGLWQWIALTNSYTCARGEFMALVIDYSSGTVNATNCSTFTSQFTGQTARTGFPYVIHNDATVRTRQANYAPWGYKSASATYGMPWQASVNTAYSSSSTPNEYGLAFEIPGAGCTYQVAGVRAVITSPAATKSILVSLYDGTTALQTVTVDGDALRVAATAGTSVEYYFDEVTLSTLNGDTTYYLGFAPQETAANLALSCWQAASAQDAAAPGGDGNWYLVTRSGGAWTSDLTMRPVCEPILASYTAPTGGGVTAQRAVVGQAVTRAALW